MIILILSTYFLKKPTLWISLSSSWYHILSIMTSKKPVLKLKISSVVFSVVTTLISLPKSIAILMTRLPPKSISVSKPLLVVSSASVSMPFALILRNFLSSSITLITLTPPSVNRLLILIKSVPFTPRKLLVHMTKTQGQTQKRQGNLILG